MSQGMALDLFTRLAQVTGDPAWRAAADHTFESFLLPPKAGVPWVVHTDASHNLWLEEYPRWPWTTSDFTLNGHLFAVFGLDSYARMTNDPRALALWDGGLRTAAVLAPRAFRNPGWYSDYCLSHGAPGAKKHFVHIDEFLHAHAATGSADLRPARGQLRARLPHHVGAGSVLRVARQGHALDAERGTHRRHPQPHRPRVDQRGGRPATPRARPRHLVPRLRPVSCADGGCSRSPSASTSSVPARCCATSSRAPCTSRRAATESCASTRTGSPRGRSGSLAAPGTSTVDRSGVIRGIAAVHVATGPLAGLWVPFGTGRLD